MCLELVTLFNITEKNSKMHGMVKDIHVACDQDDTNKRIKRNTTHLHNLNYIKSDSNINKYVLK